MRTKILNANGESIPFEIQRDFIFPGEGGIEAVKILVNAKLVGRMRYSLKADTLYINRMDNYSKDSEHPLKYIGSLLLEYAFRQSIEEGKEGRIQLDSVGESPVAYYKMGFRKIATSYLWLKDCILDFQTATETEKTIKAEAIREHDMFKFLCKDAQVNSGKDLSELSLEEIIEFGTLDPYNQDFDKLIKENQFIDGVYQPLIKSRYMNGIMHLPEETIKSLKEKLGLEAAKLKISPYRDSFYNQAETNIPGQYVFSNATIMFL